MMDDSGTFGAELRRLRRTAGLSLTELARRVHFSKGYLSKVENGQAPPNRALAALCDDELGAPGTLRALVPEKDQRRVRPDLPGTPAPRLIGLPAPSGHFTGRTAEIAEIRAALVGTPATAGGGPPAGVCVIHGMAGVGKTALAVRAAYRLESHFDGCVFVDLQGYRHDAGPESAASALERLLRLLGVPGDHIPIGVDDRIARYRELLRDRRLLIVLDNAYNGEQVVPLLPAQPRCRMLITSRNRLVALDDAHHVSLDLLPLAQAASLFRAIARLRPADQEAGTAAGTAADAVEAGAGELVERVVRDCGRLPLAVRIAAARYRAHPAWTLPYLAQRLADERGRLAELDDGERSVAAAFALSHRELTVDQRRMFELLALHPGPDVDGYAAAALAESGRQDAERLLERLLDAHLIVQPHAGRYRFHDLVRVFAADRAAAVMPPPARHQALGRLLDYYLYTADRADRLLTPHRYRFPLDLGGSPAEAPQFADRDDALRWITTELPNLVDACRAAAEYGRDGTCWRLAFTLRGFFFLTKAWDAWRQTHELALDAARRTGDRQAEATTLNNIGLVLIESGDLDAASTSYQRALALFREVGDRHGATNSLANHAWVHHYRGDHRRARDDLRAAHRAYARAGSRRNSAISLRGIGLFEAELGMFDEAVRDIESALRAFNELGVDLDATIALNNLGDIRHRMGQPRTAAALYRQAVALARACSSRFEEARAEAGLGAVAAGLGDSGSARRHWERALRLFRALGAPQAAEVTARLAGA